MTEMLATARGYVNTWQCDENNHLNVQFFTAFAYDASMQLCGHLGFGPAAQRGTGLRVSVVEDHIRYYRELRCEDVIEVVSAPVEIGQDEIVIYNEIRNAYDGSIAATVRSVLACRTAVGGSGNPWPEFFRAAAQARALPLPDAARPRSAGTLGPMPDIRMEDAATAGLIEICRNVVLPGECDIEGRLLPRHHFARYSDGAAGLWQALGFDRAGMRARHQGTVVLEMKHRIHRPLAAGHLAVAASALLAVSDKTLHFAHFLFDGESGDLAAAAEAVAVLFDQDARRVVTLPAEDQARLAGLVVDLAALRKAA